MMFRPNRVFDCHALAAGVLAAGLFAARPVEAETTRTFELNWRAPPGCPSSAEVEREIARLIGSGGRNRGTVRAFAEASGKDGEWRVQIRLLDGENVSERSFEGGSCRAVTKVASLIIALAIEPNAGNSPDVAPPPKEKVELPPAPPPRPPEPREPGLRATLAAGPFAAFGILPRAAWGFEIGAGLRWPAFAIDVRGGATLAQSADVSTVAAGGNFSLFTAGLRGCARFFAHAPEMFVCATGLVDRVRADGYGVTSPGSATALVGAVGLGPRIDVALTHALTLSLAGEGTFAFGETSFRLDNVGNVHRTPQWGGSLRFDAIWHF